MKISVSILLPLTDKFSGLLTLETENIKSYIYQANYTASTTWYCILTAMYGKTEGLCMD